ncbi:MAG TPA: D-alanyl-D-alanine carboxypeptidase family protein [Burkholderiaceae bacterium]|nr:D-alanyl-D-alanine carboxypeptidase family protein [Burkholderiaceae bacterium]
MLSLLLLLLATGGAFAQSGPVLAARAWTLVDATSGLTLTSSAATERLEPASLTKLMTAYVVFTALGEKRTRLDASVKVSATALAAPGRAGSRMYIEPGRPVTVDELLRGLIVVSGNDAAVALAEHTAGSGDAFVERMNAEARRLGMTNTRFANATGLSDSQHYSSAADLARLAQRLLSDFPQYAPLFAQREFTYNRITQSNRNRLLWSDGSVDGLKTGHTEGAGWSVIATAARVQGTGERAFNRRLIAVVLGAASDSVRAQEALRLLNFGYSAFDTVRIYKQGDVLARAEVWKGDAGVVPIGIERDVYVTVPTDALRALGRVGMQSMLERNDPLLAPLRRGETVGRLRITAGGQDVATVPVVALDSVGEAGLFGRAYDAVRLWWRRRN